MTAPDRVQAMADRREHEDRHAGDRAQHYDDLGAAQLDREDEAKHQTERVFRALADLYGAIGVVEREVVNHLKLGPAGRVMVKMLRTGHESIERLAAVALGLEGKGDEGGPF